MDVKKSIVKTVWLTLLTMFLLTIVAGVVFVFAFTKQCADFVYDIGCNNIASILYYKEYKNNGDIAVCYKALNIKISLKDYESVVKYYESFVSDDEYADFMQFVSESREQLDVSIIEKGSILNEKNYLVNNYVKALINTAQKEKAKDIALSEFVLYDNFSFKQQGAYCLGHFIELEDWELFGQNHSGLENILIDEMQEYFDSLMILFDSKKSVESNVEKSYLFALANRIIDLGQDINTVYSALDMNSETISNNVSDMLIINNVIKGII